jgi:hypothetical protein
MPSGGKMLLCRRKPKAVTDQINTFAKHELWNGNPSYPPATLALW